MEGPEESIEPGLSWNTFRSRYASLRSGARQDEVSRAYARYKISPLPTQCKSKCSNEAVLSMVVYKSWRVVSAYLRQHPEVRESMKKDCGMDLSLTYFRTSLGNMHILLTNDEIAGIAGMSLEDDGRYYLNAVCVFGSYRGRGYCSKFIPMILADEEYRNKRVYLEVDRTNEVAVRCYIRSGFVYGGRYDDIYDTYTYTTTTISTSPTQPISLPLTLNLLIYAIASNDPGLPQQTGAVSLELGVMADIGKLFMAANNSTSLTWRATMYVDMYPHNYIITAYRDSNKELVFTRTTIQDRDRKGKVVDRFSAFITRYYNSGSVNGLVVGGHGMPYKEDSAFVPVAYTREKKVDRLRLVDISESILTLSSPQPTIPTTKKGKDVNKDRDISRKPFSFFALDTCCLSTLEAVVTLQDTADYILAYQAEGPWNGFITTNIFNLCSIHGAKACLERSMVEYANQAESQENPSPVTLIDTGDVKELARLSSDLPSSGSSDGVDLLVYARQNLKKHAIGRFETAFKNVVIRRVVPSNYTSSTEQHGLTTYL